jgi:hypothetical protein
MKKPLFFAVAVFAILLCTVATWAAGPVGAGKDLTGKVLVQPKSVTLGDLISPR